MNMFMTRRILSGLFFLLFGISTSYAQRSFFNIGSKVVDTSPSTANNSKKSTVFASASSEVGGEETSIEDLDDVSDFDENFSSFRDCEVGFENVKITLESKGNKAERIILDGSLKGVVKPGRMLAVMGPSGGGKSSFLHAIAGRIKEDKKIKVYGERYVNGRLLSGSSKLPAAIIEQEVNFFPHMTVQETLDFRVALKLGSTLNREKRDAMVQNLMETLGLTKAANTVVGNAKVRGISGGERKRLSIACELISSPSVLLLDEPTSGLDSFQASQVVSFLRKLANEGQTIIAVIHQPSQSVLTMFDDLLLMSEGRMMYSGELSKFKSYISNLGLPCPKDTGLAEHILDCVSRTNGGDSEQQEESDKRINFLAEEAIKSTEGMVLKYGTDITISKDTGLLKGPASNIFKQFQLLLSRALKETVRGKTTIVIKMVQQVTLGLLYGGMYKVGTDQASVMDRFGLLSLVAIGSMNMAVASTIRSFTKEKSIVSSEIAGRMYKTLPYFLAKAISEIPLAGAFNAVFGIILYPLAGLQKGKFKQFLGLTTLHTLACEAAGLVIGAIAPSSDVALSLFPALVVVNIIFDGRNLSEENTPRPLKFLQKISLIRWGFEGLSVNEFTGLKFEAGGPRLGPIVKFGEEALDRFGMAERKLSEVISAQRNLILSCWGLTFLALSLTSQKFEKMV